MADDFIPTDEDATRREDGLVGWDEHGPIFEAPEPEVVSRLLMAADGAPWWPRASREQLAGTDGGSILDGYGPKGLWHSTETGGWPGYATGFFPHMTVGLVNGLFKARQHIPFNRACRALRNESGGVQTNRTGVKQVEIITRADLVDEIGLAPPLEDGLAEWATWLKAEWGVPMTCTVTFKEYPASYGKGNGVRLTGAAWESYAGWLGHQHAPENDHGDPGALDWRRILRPTEEDDMPYTPDQIKAMVREVLNEGTGGGQTTWANTSKATLRVAQETYNQAKAAADKASAIATRTEAIEDDVDHLVETLTAPPPPPASTAQQVGP